MVNLSSKAVFCFAALFIAASICCNCQSSPGEAGQAPPQDVDDTSASMPTTQTAAHGEISPTQTFAPGEKPTPLPAGVQAVDYMECPFLPAAPEIDIEGLPPLSIELFYTDFPDYVEDPDFLSSYMFDTQVSNASGKEFESIIVMVQFYDQVGNPLSMKTESCHFSTPSGESCWIPINIDKEEIPAGAAAFNLFAESIAVDGTRYETQLSDHSLTGSEWIEERESTPILASNSVWQLPPEGYNLGSTLSIHFDVFLLGGAGEAVEGALCGSVLEFKRDSSGQLFSEVLNQTCQPVTVTGDTDVNLEIPFTPSGYSWIEQESDSGSYTPEGILGCLTLGDESLESYMPPLYLPPVQVEGVWWVRDGLAVDTYRPGEPLTNRLSVKSLVTDATPYTLTVQVMRYDADSRLLSWFIPIPLVGGLICASGACDDLFLEQDFQIQLVEGETLTYEFDVTFPAADEEYYRILYFNDKPFWSDDDRIFLGD